MNKGRTRYYLAGVVSLITFAVYLIALRNEFVWDDYEYVINNAHIRSLDSAFFRWAFFDFYSANWHPLAWVSHALDYAVWGLNPWGHHLTGILIHAINVFMVVLLATRLMESVPAPFLSTDESSRRLRADFQDNDHHNAVCSSTALFLSDYRILIAGGVTGLLFGIHPLHVESVAWVAERKDVLCCLFFLLSVTAYAGYACSSVKKGYSQYLLSFFLFVLALLSKPMAVSLPVVLLILDWCPFRRIRSLRTGMNALLEKLPFFVFSAISAAITIAAQKTGGAMSEMEHISLWPRLIVASKALGVYLLKMALPVDLSPFYPYPRLHEILFLSPGYLLPVLLCMAITAGCLVSIRKRDEFLSAWLYYGVVLLPVIGIIQVGPQAMADRYTYLPSLGPFFLVGVGAAWLWDKTDSRYARRACIIAGLALIMFMSYKAVKQITVWRNPVSFWSRVIEMAPERVPLAYYNRGCSFKEKGQLDLAVEDFTAAITLNPAVDAYTNRGIVYWQKGLLERSMQDFTEAITLDPSSAISYGNRGLLFKAKGEYQKALSDYGRALSLRPDFVEIYLARGDLFAETAEVELALKDYGSACALGSDAGCGAMKRFQARYGNQK